MRVKKFSKLLDMTQPIINDLIASIPDRSLSEGMINRDNFFHSCWILLKSERPDLQLDMDRCELIIAGYDPDGSKDKTKTGSDEDKKENEEGMVM